MIKLFLTKPKFTGKIIALVAVYNQKENLANLLNNLQGIVDGVVVLDDGSTDGSGEVAKNSKLVLEVIRQEKTEKDDYNVGRNLEKMFVAAKKYQPGWFLIVDPDERFELAAAEQIKKMIAEKPDKKCFGFPLKELWDNPNTYRVDGIWGQKVQWRLIKNASLQVFTFKKHHVNYPPIGVLNNLEKNTWIIDANLYHLKMIDKKEREKRRKKFESIDPGNKYQSVKYDYLTDENDLTLEKIPPERKYEK